MFMVESGGYVDKVVDNVVISTRKIWNDRSAISTKDAVRC